MTSWDWHVEKLDDSSQPRGPLHLVLLVIFGQRPAEEGHTQNAPLTPLSLFNATIICSIQFAPKSAKLLFNSCLGSLSELF